MRCKYCGSSAIHHANEYKDFSVGKAIAGTVVFGPIGAVAGVTGKKIEGFRCPKCGGFMEKPMDTTIEKLINDAIYDAKKGNAHSRYGYYKQQYPNIEEVDYKEQASAKITERFHSSTNIMNSSSIEADSMRVKRKYYYGKWDPDSPIFIDSVVIKSDSSGDYLNLIIYNQSEQIIRSLYLQASVYDDAGDILNTSRCVYQGVNVESGHVFPVDKAFRLDTELAYRVDLLCEKAVFASDEVWRMSDETVMYQVEEPEIIDKDDFPRYKHLLKAYKDISNNKGTNYPRILLKTEEYWRCLCGLPVKNGRSCPHCGCSYEDIQKICAQSFLEKAQHDAVINIASERAKKTQEGFKQAKDKIHSDVYKFASQYKVEGTIESLSKAAEMFGQISTYKDAASKAEECQNLIISLNKRKEEEKKAKEERERAEKKAAEEKAKKVRRKGLIAAVSLVLIVVIILISTKAIIPNQKYTKAASLMENGQYKEAELIFIELGDYKDSPLKLKENNYLHAKQLMEQQDFDCIYIFEALGNYKDSENLKMIAEDDKYIYMAEQNMNAGEYQKAIEDYGKVKNAEKVDNDIKEAKYQLANRLIRESGNTDFEKNNQARELFSEIGGYKDADDILSHIILRPTEVKNKRKYKYDASGIYTGYSNLTGVQSFRSAPKVEYEDGCIVKKEEEGTTSTYEYDNNKYLIMEVSEGYGYRSISNIEYVFDEEGRVVQRTKITTGEHLHDVWTYKYSYSNNGQIVAVDYDLNGRQGETKRFQIDGRKVVKYLYDQIVYSYIWCPNYDPNIITYPEAGYSLGYF